MKKINVFKVFCFIVLFLEVIWMQKSILFPNISSTLFQIVYYMKYFGSAILFILALLVSRDEGEKKQIRNYFNLFVPLLIFYIFLEFFVILFGNSEYFFGFSSISRFFAFLLDKLFIVTGLCSIVYICKEETMKVIAKVFIYDFFLIFIMSLLKLGWVNTIDSMFAFSGFYNSGSSVFEVHEATFCIGLLIIYYLFMEKNIKMSLLLSIIFLIGDKRIGILALIICCIMGAYLNKKKKNSRSMIVISLILIVSSILYVGIIYNGKFQTYMEQHNINLMGRNVIYKWFVNKTDFSLFYKPWGIGSTGKLLERATKHDLGNMYKVRGVHNDFLKRYIEYGLCGMVIWLWFIFIKIPLSSYKFEKNNKVLTIFLLLNVYAFITYLTDNTENYFVFQTILYLIPLYTIMYHKDNKENDYNEN